jgi:2,4-dienoyl-CoA reductase-like NADH-dependent reductase (Old Yellow Enzyme family)
MKSDWVRIASLKTVESFRQYLDSIGVNLPCDDKIETGAASPLSRSVEGVLINGKRIGNRFAVQPMEGWDGSRDGGVTADVLRRWTRFGQSGAKLICGGEAMAVRADGRANPHQLIIGEATRGDLAKLRETLAEAHRESHGTTEDLVIGFQLTHSGRFSRPDGPPEPQVAWRHPVLDKRFATPGEARVMSDAQVRELIGDYARAARIAWEAGADFVDIKHCHGYLLHEFLGAFERPGDYGGSFENRTRILREIIEAIRADGNPISIGVRVSAIDTVPFKPDPALSQPGKPGPGVPEEHPVPYRCAFGVNQERPLEHDLSEPLRFVKLCGELGVKVLNVTAGSPYYCPHLQRPAAYPPSDGYQPPHDPLVEVARQIEVTRQIKAAAPGMVVVGSAYSYLQEFLPVVAQAVVRNGWADMVGLGRMILSYPQLPSDILSKGVLNTKTICRTFSDCTSAPRNGMVSGCYPLDKYYGSKPEAARVKALKRT